MDGDGLSEPSGKTTSYRETFEDAFPFYLSIGMSYDEYWNGDASLTNYYRKAHYLRLERKNQEMWLQGMYIYEAIADLSPILHAFAKAGTKAKPYPSEPYNLGYNVDKEQERKENAKERKKFDEIKAKMEAFTTDFNKRFETKQGGGISE